MKREAKAMMDIAKRLMNSLSAGEDGRPVQHFETHLSHVFLAGDKAYKIKKSVRMPFVDFTMIEQRRSACLAELETNRRLGSPLYQDVVPVAEDAEGVVGIGGKGRIIDWAVVMRRFDPALQFDELARVGRLNRDLAIRTADRIADMHASCEPVMTAGHVADYRHIIRNLRKTESDGAARMELEIGEPSPYAALDAELSRIDPLIRQRRDKGKVRRVHGDLHLRNICLLDGEPTPFDALEFDDRLATTDVLYDLAFLLMDLRHYGKPQLANAVMNRYWDATSEDESALGLLPFFMSLRAAIRMAVAVEAGELEDAQSYRLLAFDLLRRAPPILAAIGGLSGAGKSTVAADVAWRLPGAAGARLLRSDVLRKSASGAAPETKKADAAAYTMAQRAHVYRRLEARAAAAVSAGASVVADATFSVSLARDTILSVRCARVRGFWLDAPLSVRLARVAGRSRDASDADVNVALSQAEPADLGAMWRRVDASRNVDDISKEILEELVNVGDATREARNSPGEG